MFNHIEKLDTFLGLIEADEEKESTPIFVKTIKSFDQNTYFTTGSIIIQTQYDTGLFLMHIYTDGITPVLQVPNLVYPFLKHYFDDDKVKELEKMNKYANEKMDKQLDAEKEKLVKLLRERGFRIIIDGVWTQ